MPNKKKSNKKKEKKPQKNLNAENINSLKRLSSALTSLDDKGTSDGAVSSDGRNIGLRLNHWRDLDDEVNHVYKMLYDGAELIKATSTKYTLVGKINVDDGSRFSVSFHDSLLYFLYLPDLLVEKKETHNSHTFHEHRKN